jgi:AraC-like DNA-binding protein
VLIGIALQIVAYIESPGYQAMPGKKEDYIYEKTVHLIRENIKDGIDFQQLADTFNVSYPHFRKLFKDKAGIPLTSFLIRERLNYSKKLLHTSELTIEEISEKCGFNSIYYFSKLFREREGVPPGCARKQNSLSLV